MMLTRKNNAIVRKALANAPVAALLGPRQCGKTTLAKSVLDSMGNSIYLDLERPDDQRALVDAQAFFKLHRDKILCLDEIQRVPELFPIIRSEVDETGNNGRILVLGSASPELIRQSSESLAGRIRYVELTPFAIDEIQEEPKHMRKLWLRGGYPRSFLAKTEEDSFEWRQDFVQTFLERDIPSMGFKISSNNIRRFWTMLTHLNAQVLNRSKLGESIGVSHHTVQHYLDILVDSFMIRSLPPLEINVRKRIVKSPKVYFRDTGILHVLAGIKSQQHLLSHPDYGYSWESFALENICGDSNIGKNWQAFFYGTHSSGEIDLILENGRERIGVEFKVSSSPGIPPKLGDLMSEAKIDHAWIVAPVKQPYPAKSNVTVGSPLDFISWIRQRP